MDDMMRDMPDDMPEDGRPEGEFGTDAENDTEDYLDGSQDDKLYGDSDDSTDSAVDDNQKRWDLITKWTMEYKNPDISDTEKETLRNKIVMELMQILIPGSLDEKGLMRRGKYNLTAAEQLTVLSDLIVLRDLLARYNPAKGPLQNYIRNCFRYALKDYSAKSIGISYRKSPKNKDKQEKTDEQERGKGKDDGRIYVESLNVPSDSEAETGRTLQDDLMDTRAGVEEEVVARDRLNRSTLSLITLMFNFICGTGKREAEQRRYNRLFFTDDIVCILRTCHVTDAIRSRRNDVLRTLSFPFIDFFMKDDFSSRQNQTLVRIYQGSMKHYCDIIEGDKDCEIKPPLPNRIYTTYLFRAEGKKVGDPAVANHKKKYMKLKEKCLIES